MSKKQVEKMVEEPQTERIFILEDDFLKKQVEEKGKLIEEGRKMEEEVFKIKNNQNEVLRKTNVCKYNIYKYITENKEKFGLMEWEVVNQVDINKKGEIVMNISDEMEGFKFYFKQKNDNLLEDFKKGGEEVQEVK
jgi:hypothetical protein